GGGGPGGDAFAWLIGGDHRLLPLAPGVHGGDPALAWLHLVAPHEPGVDPRSGGDRRPDLFRAGRQDRLQLDLERVGHRQVSCAASGSGFCVAGIWWSPTTPRWLRPSGTDSSW